MKKLLKKTVRGAFMAVLMPPVILLWAGFLIIASIMALHEWAFADEPQTGYKKEPMI